MNSSREICSPRHVIQSKNLRVSDRTGRKTSTNSRLEPWACCVHLDVPMDNDIRRPDLDDPQTHAIIGAAIAVHRHMGRGFLEQVYPLCLAIEFQRQGIPFEREVALPVHYDGIPLPVTFRVDFVCYGAIVVEVKALPRLTPREEAQLLNYLKASNMHRGLLLNFGDTVLGKMRKVWGLPPGNDPLRTRANDPTEINSGFRRF